MHCPQKIAHTGHSLCATPHGLCPPTGSQGFPFSELGLAVARQSIKLLLSIASHIYSIHTLSINR